MATATESETWISKAQARRLLGISPAKLDQFLKSGALSVRQLPGGSFARLRLSEVEALGATHTRPAVAAGRIDTPPTDTRIA